MAEILFYHLTETKVDEAMPPLLEKCLERGWRVVVQASKQETCEKIDGLLWAYRADSFLPHAMAGGEFDKGQPILLCCDESNENEAQVRFVVDGASPGELSMYERAVFMFDGHNETELSNARVLWKALKSKEHDLTYWQQTPEKRWVKKA